MEDIETVMKGFRELFEELPGLQRKFMRRFHFPKMTVICLALSKGQMNGMTPQSLTEHFKVSPSAVTQVLNMVEAQGLITRSINEQDRRSLNIELTEKGRQLVAEADAQLDDNLYHLIESIGVDDAKELLRIIHKAIDVVWEESA
ncbi:MAG: MarR family transcriptional regulator [Erysipelotrichaceae bacterium]|jgi:DNA-binding MarR family transcriptional regulator|nr:MarR family transcriptional regulator [Erysipelotrichaceae bacterium]